jgi:HSP20 family protein
MPDVASSRWDPMRDLLTFHEQLGHLVGTDAPGWTPPADLYETETAFVLTMELPGLARHEIDIHAEEKRVVIRGGRSESPVAWKQYHRVERGHGPFSRAFSLPEPMAVDSITADLKDGLLTVTMPKASEGGTRRVDVT